MRGKKHADEVQAQVIAALLAGQGVTEVARQYKLDKSVVSRLKKAIPDGELQQVATEKRERLGDLVESHLTNSLKAATRIAEKVVDDAWFAKQNAADIAVLYGVLTDKAIRILEAAESANQQGGEGETGEGV